MIGTIWFHRKEPLPDDFKLVKSAGFDCVSLFREKRGKHLETAPDSARSAGLEVNYVHAEYIKSNALWLDEPLWDTVLKEYTETVDECHRFNVGCVVLHLSSGDDAPACNDLGIGRLSRLVDYAGERGVTVALENLRKPLYLDYVFERIKADNLKLCFDTGHANLYAGSEAVLDKHGDKLAVIHLHDNDGVSDQHKLPFDGIVDWETVCGKIRRANRNIIVSLEATKDKEFYAHLTDTEFAREAFARARKLAAMIRD
jgi:sugar phosphate isomerase/epimerase